MKHENIMMRIRIDQSKIRECLICRRRFYRHCNACTDRIKGLREFKVNMPGFHFCHVRPIDLA